VSIARFSVNNPVAANLLMVLILVAGLASLGMLQREFFPETEPDEVGIRAIYRGANPMEIEKSVTVKIENAIQAVYGVEEYDSTITEGVSNTEVEVEDGADAVRVRRDLESEVAKIDDLPDEIERIDIQEDRRQIPVMALIVHGDVGEDRLRDAIVTVREELLRSPEISDIHIIGARDPEIAISIHPDRLEKYGLTFAEVAQRIRTWNADVPGGTLRTSDGNIRVRTLGESDRVRELEKIPVRSLRGGATVTLGELATIEDGFEDVSVRGRYQGRPAMRAIISKTPEEDALKISDMIHEYIEEFQARGPQGYDISIQRDWAAIIRDRIELMRRNAFYGLALVFLALALFLDLRVAFWAAMGLPISFMGAFLLMLVFGHTINTITLFALIVVLGMLVDDAIVIGENIYRLHEEEGLCPREAAIRGADQMAKPVVAAILTTMAAFLPLCWLGGAGRFAFVIPFVVIAALGVSLLEALAILPAHLAEFMATRRTREVREAKRRGLLHLMNGIRNARDWLVEVWLVGVYEKILRLALAWRYVLTAGFVGLAIYAAGLPLSGKLKYVIFEKTDSDEVYINLEMPAGTTARETEALLNRIEQVAMETPRVETTFTVLGTQYLGRGRQSSADPSTVGQITVGLVPAEERNRLVDDVIADIRENLGDVEGVKSLTFSGSRRAPRGDRLTVRVMGEDIEALTVAVTRVKEEMAGYKGVKDISDDLKLGKLEAKIRLRPSAANLGLSVGSVAQQLRSGVFGVKAQTLQRGTEEVEVWARLNRGARSSLADVENLRIATPRGGRAPFSEVAQLNMGRGLASLARRNGKRTLTVSALVEQEEGNTLEIADALMQRLSALPDEIPGIQLELGGTYEESEETLASLFFDFGAAILLIYTLIAVLFHSYLKPLVIMTAIPFSLVGATLGHYWTGWNLGLMSIIGMVALAGIVVNDSIVLVDFIRRYLEEGMSVIEAVVRAGKRRLRAIILTTLTTILGLAPLMLEKSVQARFMIPMATSITWGLAFSTVLTLVLLPSLYLIHEDLRSIFRWGWTGRWLSIHEGRQSPEMARRMERLPAQMAGISAQSSHGKRH
jgi:HAE1 family hydrophobic/amphiphilic exporter-1